MTNAPITRIIRIARERLQAWYEGEFVPHQNDPGSRVVRIGGAYKRSLSARILRRAVEFWRAHWQWLIPVVLSIFALRER